MNSSVFALTVYNGNLIAGGPFTSAGGTSATGIAQWNGTTWQSLGTGTNGIVYAVTLYNGSLIAAGFFTTAGSASANNIASWDGTSWHPLGLGTDGTPPYVQALTVYGNNLIAGGLFTIAGEANAHYIAQWDGTTWQALGTGISGFGYVDTMAVYNGNLYVGGQFPGAGGTNAHDFATWDGTSWHSLGTGMNATPLAMTLYNGKLIVAGDFTRTPNLTSAKRIAQWDGATWQSLSLGMNDDVQALTVYGNYLIAGGQFSTAGGIPASHWARWGQTPLVITAQPSGQSVCVDGTAGFSVAATGDGMMFYQWRRGLTNLTNNGSISGATTANLTISPAALTDADSNYNCVITDQCGSVVTSGNAALAVVAHPSSSANGPYQTCATDAVSLSGSSTNSSGVIWSSTGTGSFNNDRTLAASYTPSEADVAAGSVTLTLQADSVSPCTTPATSNATLTIRRNPTVDAGIATPICSVSAAHLSGGSTNSTNCSWATAGDGSFDDASSLTAIYTPGPNDISAELVRLTLTCDAIAPCSDSASDSIDLSILPEPIADAGAGQEICDGGTATMAGSADNSSGITWSTAGDGAFDDIHSPSAVYTPGPGDLIAGSAMITLTADPSAPCSSPATDSILVQIRPRPTVDVGPDLGVCLPNSANLAGVTGNSTSCLWTTSGDGAFDDATNPNTFYTPGPGDVATELAALTLTCQGNSPCTGSASGTVNISINSALSISPQPVGGTIGVGAPFTFEVLASGGGVSYQWKQDGNPIPLANGSSYSIASATVADAGVYTVVVSNNCGSMESNPAELIVNNHATVSLMTPPGCITGSQLVVSVYMSGATATVVGGQFFLAYDNTVLDFVSAQPGDAPSTREIYSNVNEGLGEIGYAVGIPDGSSGTSDNTTMARVTFNILQNVCSPTPSLVSWRVSGPNGAESKLSDPNGDQILINSVSLSAIKIDNTPPSASAPNATVQCPVDIPSPATDLASFLANGGSANDNCGSVTIAFVGDSPLSGGPCGGTVTRRYRATDGCGNTSECTQVFGVHDTIAPVISDPEPIGLYYSSQAAAEAAAKASALAAAGDNCSGALTASASTLGDCSAVISVTVSDQCGNVSDVAEFHTRIDDTDPSITTCAADQAAPANANCQAAVPNFTVGLSASDNCSATANLVITQNPTAGTLVGLGPTPITVTVVDQAGNSTTCSANFQVADQTPPTISGCPANITANVNSSNCTAVVTWSAPTAADNCGAATVTQTSGPAPGSVFTNGSVTTIQYTATDSANLTSVCSFTISVVAFPDLNNDNVVDLQDVPYMVNVLLGLDTTPYRLARADVNCDGFRNGLDLQPFVDALLN